jgi:DNA-directed RNA polymerase subunit E'/Rpb7
MANLIRLKQIESGSALNTAAQVGTDFSASVISVVIGEVTAVLPDGVVSSSAQVVDILVPLNQFTASLDLTYATDTEVYVSQSNINIDMGEW